ncbi:MAG: riboflavin synthase [Gammaproteobacteria bacterium]|nr:riboflavin synthase [Gammaproteobacteria bacterium]|tara:strand:+ start:394 stop:981 length:588 start_codon:yes stop_codon:yes gene_type:complete
MFTGIIQAKGRVKEVTHSDKGAVFVFDSDSLDMSSVSIGDSIAVNGVCLTVTDFCDTNFSADVSQETLDCSIFDKLQKGQNVNLEKSLRLNQGIDGHFVSGHVDGIGIVDSIYSEGESKRMNISINQNLEKYVAKKGSVCINGVSLTVNSIENNIIGINIVPHTFAVTTFGELEIGSRVNIEIDIIARHLEKLVN